MRAFRWVAVLLTALALILLVSSAEAVGTVSVRVRQPDGTTAVVDAEVDLFHVGETAVGFTTTSNGAGNYSLSSIPDGSYDIRALSANFGVVYYNDSVTRGGAIPIVITNGSNSSINLIFNSSGKIDGVIDVAGSGAGGHAEAATPFVAGSPVVEEVEMNVEAAFLHQRGETYGSYLADEMARGGLILADPMQLIAPEYQMVRGIDEASTIWALSTMPHAELVNPLTVGGATVEGHNLDTNVFYTTTTDPTDGSYLLKSLPPGRYKVNAYAPSYVREWYNDYYSESAALAVVLVGDGQTIDMDFALDKAGSVTGTVYDGNGVTPLNNRRVMWVSPNHTSLVRCTDASGHYTLPDAPTNAAFTVFSDFSLMAASFGQTGAPV